MDLKSLIPSFGRKNQHVRKEEEHSFLSLHREMSRLFENFLQAGIGPGFDDPAPLFTPRIDMAEDGDSVIVSAELPGMDEKDIEVSLSGDLLSIRGEKRNEQKKIRGTYFHSERSFGSFSRTISVPQRIDADKVSASFRKGILTVTLPKAVGASGETKGQCQGRINRMAGTGRRKACAARVPAVFFRFRYT
jgi:HSP20 family protein